MANVSVNDIREAALQILAQHPEGIHYSQLARKTLEAKPDANEYTVYTTVKELPHCCPDKVVRPARGLFVLANGPMPPPATVGQESDFYPGFAQWLQEELDEVTVAAPLDGAGLVRKWATPDVVGVYRSSFADMLEIVPENEFAEGLKRHDENVFRKLFG